MQEADPNEAERVPPEREGTTARDGQQNEVMELLRRAIDEPGISGQIAGLLSKMAPQQYRSILHAFARETGAGAVAPLQSLAEAGNPDLELAAIEAAGATRSPAAARWVASVADTSPVKPIQKAARRALHHLVTAGVALPPPAPREAPRARHAFVISATSVDGAGTRHLSLGVEGAFGVTSLVTILINDIKGILRVYGGQMPREEVIKAVVVPPKTEGIIQVGMPVDYAMQLVAEAAALNAETATPFPAEYARWRDAVTAETITHQRPIIYREISPAEVMLRPDLLEDSPKLLELPVFATWVFDFEHIKPFSQQLLDLQQSKIVLPEWTKREMEDRAIRSATESLIPPDQAARLKRRLEEMAYVLLQSERPLDARRALAAALGFEGREGAALAANPFVKAMVRRGLDLGIQVLQGHLPAERLQLPA